MVDAVLETNRGVGKAVESASNAAINLVTEASTDDLLALGFLLVLVLCVHVEFRRPCLRPGLKTLKNSYLTNVCTYLFNDITLSLLSIPSLYFIAQQFSGVGLLSPLPDGATKYILTFVLLDFTLYAWHYATHHCDGLWLFHKVHHSDRSFNVTTGLRFHMGELFLEVLVRVAFIAFFGLSAELVLVNQTIISLFVLFHHTNVTFPYEQLLSRLIIVPRLHRMHHSVLREEHDSNYGAVLSIWDRLFGTLKEGEPQAIGLQEVDEQQFAGLIKYGFTAQTQYKRSQTVVASTKRLILRALRQEQ